MNLDFITPELHELRRQFNMNGFDLRLVGGVVRDLLAGEKPKDIDLCTDATPVEQTAVYNRYGHRWIGTGMDHGTVTVVLNGVPYEITSLRVDVETDGRHATVQFTNDWHKDLARRDLTINAMALTFDGRLIDPFNGQEDLQNRRVRFVGDAGDRIQEDYLRILRWFRFMTRYGNQNDSAAANAISIHSHGLSRISGERIWSEIKRIIVHPNGPFMMAAMEDLGVARHINLVRNSNHRLTKQAQEWTRSPEVLLCVMAAFRSRPIEQMAEHWKWSKAERDHALWLCANYGANRDLCKLIAIHNAPREWVRELAWAEDRAAWERELFTQWQFDPFPVTGLDLIARGIKPSPKLGETLAFLKEKWAEMGYVATKEELLAHI